MVLQNIVWPELANQPESELYYHGAPKYTEDGCLCIATGTTISFDTYFNSFAGRIWLENTTVTNCEICVSLKGEGIVFLKTDNETVVSAVEFSGEQCVKISIPKLEACMYYLEIFATKDTVITSGQFQTSQTGREIHLGLVTCTYNRQKDLYYNLALLKKKNKQVLDYIYVVDNAKNLNPEELEDEITKVFPNPNTGGAGGFTRGLKESMKVPSMTHVLLMDDDVKIEFEAIFRTKSLLSYVKEEKQDCFIGGAMLRKEQPWLVFASGEAWGYGTVLNPHQDTDARTLEQVKKLLEPVDLSMQYNAWWYCCIPRKHIEKKGYPLPFFLHGDDIEYGLRNGNTPIFLNGIATWHESFEHKKGSMLRYYDIRNWLIINALYMEKGKRLNAVRLFAKSVLASIFRYRYEDVSLTVMAVEDFLKGPEWFLNSDSEQIHKQVSQLGYRMQDRDENQDYELLSEYTGRLPHKFGMFLGYLLPAKGKARVPMGAPAGVYAGKKEVWLEDPVSGKGFWVKKSWRKTVRCAGMLIKKSVRLLCNYSDAEKKWERSTPPKKAVYVVSTYYHALIACIKQLKTPKTADIIVTAYIPEGKDLADKIRESGLFCETIYIDEIQEYKHKNRMDYYLNYHRKNAALIEQQLPMSFYEYGEIYVFHDGIWAAHYFKDRGIYYHLIEDALDSFKTMSKYAFSYMLPKGNIKEKIKQLFNIGYFYCGLDKTTVSIEVNEKHGTEIENFAGEKIIEVPRKSLFETLSDSDIEIIKKVFAKNVPEFNSSNAALVMTRALYADGIVKTLEEQIRLHKELVQHNLESGEQIVLKAHPRDMVSYEEVFPQAIILDKNMPAEIMQYMGIGNYKKVIAFKTTRISGIITKEFIYEEL